MTFSRTAPVAMLSVACLLLAIAAGRSLVVALALPPSAASTLDPSFEVMTFSAPGVFSPIAIAAADRLGIEDRRLEAARISECLHRGGGTDCRPGVDRAAALAPYDPEIPLVQMQFDQAASIVGRRTHHLSVSCDNASREAWVSARRLPYMISLDTGEFTDLADCFTQDVATLLRSTRYLNDLAETYVTQPRSRERLRDAIAQAGGEESRWFVTRVRERTAQYSAALD